MYRMYPTRPEGTPGKALGYTHRRADTVGMDGMTERPRGTSVAVTPAMRATCGSSLGPQVSESRSTWHSAEHAFVHLVQVLKAPSRRR